MGSASASTVFKSVKSGNNLYSILKAERFNENQIARLIAEAQVPNDMTLSVGERYAVEQKPKFKEVRIYDQNAVYAFTQDNGAQEAMKRPLNLAMRKRSVRGEIRGSVLQSLFNKVPNTTVAYRFLDAYALDGILPQSLERGAKFAFEVEEMWDGANFVKFGEVLSTELEYQGRIERREFIRFSEGGGSFINVHKALDNKPLYAPVRYLKVSSHFNPRRRHPIKRRLIPHMGTDFELPEGERVYSAGPGVVERFGKQRGAGLFVVVRHADGIQTFYNHLKSIAPNLRSGMQLTNGQVIGSVGCTGYCTKAHLHFAVKKFGQFVNPTRFVKSYFYHGNSEVRAIANQD